MTARRRLLERTLLGGQAAPAIVWKSRAAVAWQDCLSTTGRKPRALSTVRRALLAYRSGGVSLRPRRRVCGKETRPRQGVKICSRLSMAPSAPRWYWKTRPLSGCASSQSRNSWTPMGWFSVLATMGLVTVTYAA